MKQQSITQVIYQSGIALLLVCGIQNVSAFCIEPNSGDQIRAKDGIYTHELWNEGLDTNGDKVVDTPIGEGCMTYSNTSGAFTATWTGIENYLARRGLGFDRFGPGYDYRKRNHAKHGYFKASYAANYNTTSICAGGAGNSYMGVYGWTRDFKAEETSSHGEVAHKEALVEYYIIENWCNWNPSRNEDGSERTAIASYTVDGSEYKVFRSERIDKFSIRGGGDDFVQYFSIRQNVRNSGDIDISHHFAKWEALWGTMGGLHEVSMLVEGYQNSGSAEFTAMEITLDENTPPVKFAEDHYIVGWYCEGVTSKLPITFVGDTSLLSGVEVRSVDGSVQVESSGANHIMVGTHQTQSGGPPRGDDAIVLYAPEATYGPNVIWDTATVTVRYHPLCINRVQPNGFPPMEYKLAAEGTQGSEKIVVTVDGAPVKSHRLTTSMKTYSGTIFPEGPGLGEVGVAFVNDEIDNARDVRADYIEVDGERRETEAMSHNSAAYANGVCGAGGYTEWLHCNGGVSYGEFEKTHTITIRARGNNGGEHINLLINGSPVNGGWWLGTSFQEYTVQVAGDGDINVQYDNDGGLKDAVIDWVKVDTQNPRQAENMEYNTGAYANGSCGGGHHTEWLHCNGVIGFGKISDNFN